MILPEIIIKKSGFILLFPRRNEFSFMSNVKNDFFFLQPIEEKRSNKKQNVRISHLAILYLYFIRGTLIHVRGRV